MDENLNSGLNPDLTFGNYQDEKLSGNAFDEVAQSTGLFRIYGKGTLRGITGKMIHPLPGVSNKDLYILDRILIPTEKLIKEGWSQGAIGVELKKSNVKVGPPLSQMLDYLRCAWIIPHINTKILIDYCFLWPMEKCGGTTASIMAQNRIGGCWLTSYKWLRFHLGEQFIIDHNLLKDETKVKNLQTGNRTGSR